MSKVIVIVGPTGVGKTKLSIELAKRFNGEVINADSTQVYKELDIATAKVREDEKENIIHHLIDIKTIEENYTVYQYQQDSRNVIDKLLSDNKTPIIVGGTGLYIKASLYDYKFNEEGSYLTFDEFDTVELYNKLITVDPNTTIHQNNRKRIIRALNYYNHNKSALSEKEKTSKILYDAIFIGLTTDRRKLYEKINERVYKMIDDGLLLEAKRIFDRNILSKAVMTPIGYKELFPYFKGESTLEDCIELIQKRSRNYAKRQYTWFNNQMDIKWFDVDYGNFNNTVLQIINYIDNEKNE